MLHRGQCLEDRFRNIEEQRRQARWQHFAIPQPLSAPQPHLSRSASHPIKIPYCTPSRRHSGPITQTIQTTLTTLYNRNPVNHTVIFTQPAKTFGDSGNRGGGNHDGGNRGDWNRQSHGSGRNRSFPRTGPPINTGATRQKRESEGEDNRGCKRHRSRLTHEELDRELDEYMWRNPHVARVKLDETRLQLDKDLDAYMADVDKDGV